MKAIEKRLQQLEARTNPKQSPPFCMFFWSDGDDPEPARLKAEADYRQANGLPDTADLFSIGIHFVSVEWMATQRCAAA